MKDKIDSLNLSDQVIAWREHLHHMPELSHKEYETTQYIIEQLKNIQNIQISTPSKTGVIARLKGARQGKTIAFRADIDALPVTEKNDFPYKSKYKSCMHACGHDAHSAILLGVAKVLAKQQALIRGEIVFIFQRGEEMSPGGAKELVDLGILNDVEMFFALHVLPELPSGVFSLKPGIASANRDTFHINIKGKGGHSSMPHLSVDPIVCGAQVILALQTIVSREINPKELSVISACSFISGDGTTAGLPNETKICGTTRTFSTETREQIRQSMQRIIKNTAIAYRCIAEVEFDSWDYSAIINDQKLCDIAQYVVKNYLSEQQFLLAESPMLIGEDFSEYKKIAPLCFIWLGVARQNKNNPPLHNSYFDPDEKAFIQGVNYFVGLANELLIKNS